MQSVRLRAQEIVKALDKKTLAALHKVVTEVSAGAEAEKQAATKAKRDADPELAAKIQKAREENLCRCILGGSEPSGCLAFSCLW